MSVSNNTPSTSFGLAIARVFWMMLGPLILALLGYNIIDKGNGWMTPTDIAYLAVLGLLIGARWFEFRSGQGQTATGEPMTYAHLTRYLALALVIGLGFWAVANFFGNR